MNRKLAFILMLLLCFSTGIAACYVVYPSNERFAASFFQSSVQATLSAPTEISQETEESLPSLPDVPEPTEPSESSEPVVSESTVIETTPSPEEETPQYRYTAIHRSRKLFIRNGPSLQADIISYLMPGESGDVIEIHEEGAWVLLKHDDIEGYVFKEYLQLDEISQ